MSDEAMQLSPVGEATALVVSNGVRRVGPPCAETTAMDRAVALDQTARVSHGPETTQIYGGTNQVQRIVMARQLLNGIQSQL
jgi:alkylation response protein AidB-like acyl-CoA dehydrogenase